MQVEEEQGQIMHGKIMASALSTMLNHQMREEGGGAFAVFRLKLQETDVHIKRDRESKSHSTVCDSALINI